MKIKPPSGPKKTNPIQTQSNPVLSAVEWDNSCGFLLEFIPHGGTSMRGCGDAGQE